MSKSHANASGTRFQLCRHDSVQSQLGTCRCDAPCIMSQKARGWCQIARHVHAASKLFSAPSAEAGPEGPRQSSGNSIPRESESPLKPSMRARLVTKSVSQLLFRGCNRPLHICEIAPRQGQCERLLASAALSRIEGLRPPTLSKDSSTPSGASCISRAPVKIRLGFSRSITTS